jgi:hypothetical protein
MFARHIFLIFLIVPVVSFARWFGPSNYDECVLDSMKGVTSDLAARAIMRSCSEKFPKKKPNEIPAPLSVVSQLDGRARMSYGFVKGNIYNGNKDWTITQVTINILVKDKSSAQKSPREYNVDLTVSPLKNEDFIFSVGDNSFVEFDWQITRARGYKSR